MRILLLLCCFSFVTKASTQHYTDYLNSFDYRYVPLKQMLPDDDGLYHHLLRITSPDSVRYKKMIVCQVENANFHVGGTPFKPDTIRKEIYYFDSINYRLIRHEMRSLQDFIIRIYQDELPLQLESYNFGKLTYTKKYFHTGSRLDSIQVNDYGEWSTHYFGTNYTIPQISNGVRNLAFQYNDSTYFKLRYSSQYGELPEPFLVETSYPTLHTITQTMLRPRTGFSPEKPAANTDTVQHTIIRLDTAGNMLYKYTRDYTDLVVFEYYFYYDPQNRLIRLKNNYNKLHFSFTYSGTQLSSVEIKDFENIYHCSLIFNQYGYCISQKCTDREEKTQYTFDEKGNWITRERYFSGKLFDVVTRQLTY